MSLEPELQVETSHCKVINDSQELNLNPSRTLVRDFQTVQAYSQSLQIPQKLVVRSPTPTDMEVKKQIVAVPPSAQLKHQDLHLSKLTRSISTSGPASSGFDISPGSPYRSSIGVSGSMNGLSSKPSLNKEIMQKLRSMTETIKMLSEENSNLKSELSEVSDFKSKINSNSGQNSDTHNRRRGDYETMEKTDLVTLVISYDEKLKSMSQEVAILSRSKEIAQTKGQEKDKYKALARRLKEERNSYKVACEEKMSEQEALKSEMEKMSVLISELRENCQSLQQELEHQRPNPNSRQIGVQVAMTSCNDSNSSRTSSVSNLRKSSISSLQSESASARKAKAVYNKPSNTPRGQNLIGNNKNASKPNNSVKNNVKAGNAKIAKPVSKPANSQIATNNNKNMLNQKKVSNSSLVNKSNSRIPQASPSRIPQAKFQASPKKPLVTPSPPPAPPPSIKPKDTPTPPLSPVHPNPIPLTMRIDEDLEGDSFFDEKSILEDEEVLLIQADGRIKMNHISSSDIGAGKTRYGSLSGDSTPPDVDQRSADDEQESELASRQPHQVTLDNLVNATPRTRRKVENFKQGVAARRIQRTWKHFYEELEEKREQNPGVSISQLATSNSPLKSSQSNGKSFSNGDLERKYSLPATINSPSLAFNMDQLRNDDSDLLSIQATIQSHKMRSISLSTLRSNPSKIHIARPWLKSKSSLQEENSSEEEMLDKTRIALQSAFLAHDTRRVSLERFETENSHTLRGIRALKSGKFVASEQKNETLDRSDGITDDDDDIVY